MHRIDGPTAAPGGLWTEGDPVGGVPATIVSDDWMNDTQENIIAVLTAASIAPVKGTYTQLRDAIQSLAGSGKLLAIKIVTVSGTYTPTAGMKNVLVRAIGGGGGSGGAPATGASAVVATGGGASGSYLEAWLTAAAIGASQSVVIGNGGSAGVVSGGGGAGGPTSLGAILLAPGGAGSAAGAPVLNTASSLASGGVSGGLASGGNITNSSGVQGLPGITVLASVLAGAGASTQFGAGGNQAASPQPGTGYGSGASGVASNPSTAAKVGAAGAPGVMVFMEFA